MVPDGVLQLEANLLAQCAQTTLHVVGEYHWGHNDRRGIIYLWIGGVENTSAWGLGQPSRRRHAEEERYPARRRCLRVEGGVRTLPSLSKIPSYLQVGNPVSTIYTHPRPHRHPHRFGRIHPPAEMWRVCSWKGTLTRLSVWE